MSYSAGFALENSNGLQNGSLELKMIKGDRSISLATITDKIFPLARSLTKS